MPPLNTGEARIIDPILSNHARGYTHPNRVAHFLFPHIQVMSRGGRRLEFNKESFKLYQTTRAPGADRKKVQFGFLGKKFSLDQHNLVGVLPREIQQEAARIPGVDMGRQAVESVQDIISLGKEYETASLARDAANYDADHKITLAGSDQWDHADSDPKSIVKEGREAIRATIGMRPNTMIIGPTVYNSLDDHPKLLEKFKYTSSESITTAMLARYFDMENVHVGEAIYADDTDTFVDVWGNDIVLAYVAPAGARRQDAPSYGYTYQLSGYPMVEQPVWEKDNKSWEYDVTDEYSPELVGAEAGYLIKDAVSG